MTLDEIQAEIHRHITELQNALVAKGYPRGRAIINFNYIGYSTLVQVDPDPDDAEVARWTSQWSDWDAPGDADSLDASFRAAEGFVQRLPNVVPVDEQERAAAATLGLNPDGSFINETPFLDGPIEPPPTWRPDNDPDEKEILF